MSSRREQAVALGSQGFRALGVADRDFNQDSFSKDDAVLQFVTNLVNRATTNPL